MGLNQNQLNTKTFFELDCFPYFYLSCWGQPWIPDPPASTLLWCACWSVTLGPGLSLFWWWDTNWASSCSISTVWEAQTKGGAMFIGKQQHSFYWLRPKAEWQWEIGLLWASGYRARSPRRAGSSLYIPGESQKANTAWRVREVDRGFSELKEV